MNACVLFLQDEEAVNLVEEAADNEADNLVEEAADKPAGKS